MAAAAIRIATLALVCGSGAVLSACSAIYGPRYEYVEDIELAIDGGAQVEVHASVAALVSLRGLALDADPTSPPDRDEVQRLFEAPGVRVTSVRLSRQARRPFVHVALEVDDIRTLGRLAPFSWASYRFERRDDVLRYQQQVGASAGVEVGGVGWTGAEQVAFRLHLPSEIPFHNAPSRTILRGNILEWEQLLTDRLAGTPIDIEVHMEPESILYRTLLLFGSTVLVAAAAFALVIWRVAKRTPPRALER